jgi:hypothetical protein
VISERIAATGQDMVPAGPEDLAATVKAQVEQTAVIARILGLARKN